MFTAFKILGGITALVSYAWAVLGLIALYGFTGLAVVYLIPVVGQLWFGFHTVGMTGLMYWSMFIGSYVLIFIGVQKDNV